MQACGTHLIASWVGFTASLDALEKGQISYRCQHSKYNSLDQFSACLLKNIQYQNKQRPEFFFLELDKLNKTLGKNLKEKYFRT